MELEDWLNADHFPPLGSSQANPSVAIGLPKHSQPCAANDGSRVRHHRMPPIVAIDEDSIAVGNLPLQFQWKNRQADQRELLQQCKSTDTIIQQLNKNVWTNSNVA